MAKTKATAQTESENKPEQEQQQPENADTSSAITLASSTDVDSSDAVDGELIPLNDAEKKRLQDLEDEIHTSANKMAFALKEISDDKLYRETHSLFEDYCSEQLGISRRFASYQIKFAEMCLLFQEQSVPLLPTSEWQIRPLNGLSSEQQVKFWLKSCKKAGGKIPSGELVQSVKKEEQQKEKGGYEPIEEGLCVRVVRASKDTIKDRIGYWGLVENKTSRGTYAVTFPDKTIKAIPREALREVELETNKLELKKDLLEQLKAIYDSNESKEPVVKELLRYFGKKQSEDFTSLEQEILQLVQNDLKKPSQ